MSNVAIRLYTVILLVEYPPIPRDLFRYFFMKISPYTASSTCQLASSCQASSNYQAVKVLTSPCFPPNTHQPDTHTTRAGKDSHSIMIIIIIIISIRLIYIFILLTILCFLLDLFLYTKRKCLFVVVVVAVFVCKFVV